MPNNVSFQSGTLATPAVGTVIATDDLSGIHHQLVKIEFGKSGTAYALDYGTPMPIGTLPGGTVQIHGTAQGLGTYQPLAGSVHLASGTVSILGTVQTLAIPGTVQVLGSVQTVGTSQALGSVSIVGTFGGSVGVVGTLQVLGSIQAHGTTQILGTTQPLAGSVHLASRLPGTVDIGTVAGTVSILGTIQPLAGSVHIANSLTVTIGTLAGGTVTTQPLITAAGTYVAARLTDGASYYTVTGGAVNVADQAVFQAGISAGAPMMGISTITAIGQGSIGLLAMGSDRVQFVRPYGGTLDGGTYQPLAGSVHIAAIPNLIIASGTVSLQTGGTIHIGSVQSIAGTVQALGTVQTHGTSQILGTTQPLAGSVHLATNFAGGTVVAVGSLAVGILAGAAMRPVLLGGVGSSGTQAAQGDGSITQLWTDLNGRLQIRGTIDSIPAIVITSGTVSLQTGGTSHIGSVQRIAGTVETLGTHQPLAGSVHLATNLAGGTVVSVGSAIHDAVADTRPHLMGAFGSSGTQDAVGNGDAVRLWADLNGRLQVRGTIDSIPNITITAGTVSLATGGTSHVGSVQRIAGTVDVGTVAGTVGIIARYQRATNYGTTITAAGQGTLVGTIAAAGGVGTYYAIRNLVISASAAGSFTLKMSGTTIIGPLFLAANGGMALAAWAPTGWLSYGTNPWIEYSASAGTMSINFDYSREAQ